VLGLTVDLAVLTRADVLVPGLVLAAVVAFVVRPVFVGLCLVPARLSRRESAFVLFAGLKGAVPLLLGELMLAAHVDGATRLYGIVAVVVIFSVLVQGSLTPAVAKVLKIPMYPIEPEPWALGVRLRDEPQGVHRFTVRRGAPADGRTIGDLEELPENAWISFIVRDRGLVVVRADTQLHAGDQVLLLGDEDCASLLETVFEGVDPTTAPEAGT
jgi:cell volume regulation protein A